MPVQFQWFQSGPNSNQWIAVIDSGVNVIVDGLSGDSGTMDISTDRLVIWTTGVQEPDLTGRTIQDQRVPMEFYMEGNIVFRQGERVIYANRMYYDVPNHVGTCSGQHAHAGSHLRGDAAAGQRRFSRPPKTDMWPKERISRRRAASALSGQRDGPRRKVGDRERASPAS